MSAKTTTCVLNPLTSLDCPQPKNGPAKAVTRVLVAEDFEPFRRFLRNMLQNRVGIEIISEVSCGFEAVQKALELQPDVVLLDIGLPTVNGMEAARRIRKHSPNSKIIFVTQESSADLVREAFNMGASGYIVKTDAGELLASLDTILRGGKFVCNRLACFGTDGATVRRGSFLVSTRQVAERNAPCHEIAFYSDDRGLVEVLTQFFGDALRVGNSAVFVGSEAHRDGVLQRLQACGVNVIRAIEQARYIAVDVETVLNFIVNGVLDPARFMSTFGNLIATAAKAAQGEHPRVVFFGEGANLLWAQGHVQAAIRNEELCNQLIKMYVVDILCGYSMDIVDDGVNGRRFQRIYNQHSAADIW